MDIVRLGFVLHQNSYSAKTAELAAHEPATLATSPNTLKGDSIRTSTAPRARVDLRRDAFCFYAMAAPHEHLSKIITEFNRENHGLDILHAEAKKWLNK